MLLVGTIIDPGFWEEKSPKWIHDDLYELVKTSRTGLSDLSGPGLNSTWSIKQGYGNRTLSERECCNEACKAKHIFSVNSGFCEDFVATDAAQAGRTYFYRPCHNYFRRHKTLRGAWNIAFEAIKNSFTAQAIELHPKDPAAARKVYFDMLKEEKPLACQWGCDKTFKSLTSHLK